ncbi:MAG TPA: YceI family protein [Candidatus Baltobacteraceae bacterium]|nr:YceI family protein [Candidatus Baltobacteraceae bacterium]
MTATRQAQQTFTIDPAHTGIEFTVRHMVISKVRGRFGTFHGTVTLVEGSNVPVAVDVEIDATSIDTREPQRDAHLKSADFLDAATYPTIAFRGTAFAGDDSAFRIDGDLTIHGVTKPVRLDASVEGRMTDPWGNDRIAFEAQGKINRKDFGLTWNQALETGGVLVGEEVVIALTVQAVRPK